MRVIDGEAAKVCPRLIWTTAWTAIKKCVRACPPKIYHLSDKAVLGIVFMKHFKGVNHLEIHQAEFKSFLKPLPEERGSPFTFLVGGFNPSEKY